MSDAFFMSVEVLGASNLESEFFEFFGWWSRDSDSYFFHHGGVFQSYRPRNPVLYTVFRAESESEVQNHDSLHLD